MDWADVVVSGTGGAVSPLPLATSTGEFLAGLPTRDLFGIGPLAPTYERSDWL
jgi:hypothetical protein